MTRLARLTILVAVAAAIVCASATAAASKGDPRICRAETPGGPAKHAYWCAHAAAVNAVRTKMAQTQHLTRWFYPTFCTQTATLLRWTCSTVEGGRQWHATVVFRHTASGWVAAVRLAP